MGKRGIHGNFAIPTKRKKKPKRPLDPSKEKALALTKQLREEQEARTKAEEERKAARGPGPSQKEKKRAARRKNRLAEGKLEQTDKTVEELMRIEGLVAFAVEDCQDEAELR